jgi:hypothetical protein
LTITAAGVGSAVITVTNNGVTAPVNVTVIDALTLPPNITNDLPSTVQRVGAMVTLSIAAASPDGGTITRQWFRVDENGDEIAIPGETGTFLMTSNTGEHFVRVTNTRGGMSVTVDSTRCWIWTASTGEPPTITVSPRTGTIGVGSTIQLTATVQNQAGETTWISSNPAIAAISGSGNTATAAGVSAGTATITAINGVRRSAAVITVSIPSWGDVDGNGVINAADTTMLRRFIASGQTPEEFREWNPDFNPANADVNGNGTIDAADVTLLRRYLAATDPSTVHLGPLA